MPTRTLAILSCDLPVAPAILSLHYGRALRSWGDTVVVGFDTGSDAVLAALDVHEQQRGARVAITAGEVHLKGEVCTGAAVEVAGRVRALVPAGETYVTDAAVTTMELSSGDALMIELGQISFGGWAQRLRVFRAIAPREVSHTEVAASWCAQLQGIAQIVAAGADGHAAHERRVDIYDRMVLAALRAHRGFVQEVHGDTYRVTFGRILDAVRAALAVQQAWRPGEHGVGGGAIRIGIDHGPVTRIAARVAVREAAVRIAERAEFRSEFTATAAAVAAIGAAAPELLACLDIGPAEEMILRGHAAPISMSQVRLRDGGEARAGVERVLGPLGVAS